MLLLNKFNIVPWHCLVVTSDYQSQLDDLNAVDLGATWRVLQVRGGGSLPRAAQEREVAPLQEHAQGEL